MTIYLPDEPVLFQSSFDAVFDRLTNPKQKAVFYPLVTELMSCLLANGLFSPYLTDLQEKAERRIQEFSKAALEALDESFDLLARYHSLSQKKILVRIRMMLTHPHSEYLSSCYHAVLFGLLKFSRKSPFCRRMRKSTALFQELELKLYSISAKSSYRQPYKKFFAKKKDKEQYFCKKPFVIFPPQKHSLLHRKTEWINADLLSRKVDEIHRKFSIPSHLTIRTLAETNPVFCLQQLMLLQKSWLFNETISLPEAVKGRWQLKKEVAWQSALEISEKLSLSRLQERLKATMSCKEFSEKNELVQGQYTALLHSLKHHLDGQLIKIKNQKAKLLGSGEINLPQQRTPKEQAKIEQEISVVSHWENYQQQHPFPVQLKVYRNYRKTCPSSLLLGKTKWLEVVTDRKLDQRTPLNRRKAAGRPPKNQIRTQAEKSI
jgi:hypothetical protein